MEARDPVLEVGNLVQEVEVGDLEVEMEVEVGDCDQEVEVVDSIGAAVNHSSIYF